MKQHCVVVINACLPFMNLLDVCWYINYASVSNKQKNKMEIQMRGGRAGCRGRPVANVKLMEKWGLCTLECKLWS